MLNEQSKTKKNIYMIGALIFVLTAWFSVGFNHFDEHFQVLEFAGLKLGLTEKVNLPWEYDVKMRPAFQPLIVYSIYKTLSLTGLTNPFMIAFIIRLLSASLTFLSIHMIIKLYAPDISNRKLLYAFLLLSFFMWFIPYNSVRFSSETVAGRVFIIGLAWFFLRNRIKPADYFITGVVLGLSFLVRYQVAFMIFGFALWLVIIQRPGFKHLFFFVAGIAVVFGLGIVIDRWYYSEWLLTSWNYFQQNLLLGKAAEFGTNPWWSYLSQTFMNAFPPLSLVLILAVILYFIFFSKDILTWTMVPFLLAHFLISHKELRFLFPIIGFLPIMIIRCADFILQKKGYEILDHHLLKIGMKLFWYLNLVMLTVLIFRPADEQIALYKKIWDKYDTPVKLYFPGDNPFHRAKVDIHFYKRSSLTFQKVDSLQNIHFSKDTVSLIASYIPILQAGMGLKPELIYTSYPPWVSHFNFNHWIERSRFWHVYELKKASSE